MYDTNGPVWYRGWAMDEEEKVCRDVETVLARTGTRRMIMGHTPDFNVRAAFFFQNLISVRATYEKDFRTLFQGVTERLLLLIPAFHMHMAACFLRCRFIIPFSP